MAYHTELPYNAPADIEWLKSTHLKGKHVPPFRSFVLVGGGKGGLKVVGVKLYPGDIPMADDDQTVTPIP